jgi:hypothetical protein
MLYKAIEEQTATQESPSNIQESFIHIHESVVLITFRANGIRLNFCFSIP